MDEERKQSDMANNKVQWMFRVLFLSEETTVWKESSLFTMVTLWMVLLRWLMGLHSYSGYQRPPMYGDYEAQRHWMEVTAELPLSEWYWNTTQNDLLYWGLDYPPLTAYVSWAYGMIAHVVEPEMVALRTSRGYENESSKNFMRLTVLFVDLLVYFPAIWYFAKTWFPTGVSSRTNRLEFLLLCLSQPALLLIDFGHFQYNNMSLGLTALGMTAIINGYEVIGSICFCMALNFKQISLYYVPAFTFWLLSRCLYRSNVLLHLGKLGITVIGTFLVLWLPFCSFPFEGTTCLQSVSQVLQRIFPFSRGLFEDKVANFWCIADFVFKVRRCMSQEVLIKVCLVLTVIGFLPSAVDLLRRKPTKKRFVLALFNCSMSFFLFSYHVHEKSILFPLMPMTLLLGDIPFLAGYFVVVSTFSMFHLFVKDGLVLPYTVCMILYGSLTLLYYKSSVSAASGLIPGYTNLGHPTYWISKVVGFSFFGIVLLHLLEACVPAPSKYPHVYLYLFAFYSFIHFFVALVCCTYWQWTCHESLIQSSVAGDSCVKQSTSKSPRRYNLQHKKFN